MSTYLMTWNPEVSPWNDFRESAIRVRRGESVIQRWSTGNTKRIVPGDRIFLLKQGKEPRGIIASGVSTTGVFEEEHWKPDRAASGDRATYVKARLDSLLEPDRFSPLDVSAFGPPLSEVSWHTPASGITIPEPAVQPLESAWASHVASQQPFRVGAAYTRGDVCDILRVPDDQRGGDWDTGYHRYREDYYVFVNVGIAGRTGHDYDNHWIGNDLHWRGKSGSKLDHPSIQSMVRAESDVYIFTREDDRAPWTYEGIAAPIKTAPTIPVTIIWAFANPGELRMETMPEEVLTADTYREGAVKTINVNVYERDPAARRACIRHWGVKCQVCGLAFEERYGQIGQDFIHVHHLRQLAAVAEAYEVDPINDLRPVCPNCHAMLHRATPPMTLEELKRRLTGSIGGGAIA